MFGADNYEVGDKLYVWAKSGLNMRSAPNVKSGKLGQLKDGSRVEILSISTKTYDILELKPEEEEENKKPFILTGTWVKVKSGALIGYVIDIYLLRYPHPPKNKGILTLLTKGSKVVRDTTWEPSCDSEGDCRSTITEWDNGVKHEDHTYSTGADIMISIPGMTVEEGYILFSYGEDFSKGDVGSDFFSFGVSDEGMFIEYMDGMCSFNISKEGGKIHFSSGCSC